MPIRRDQKQTRKHKISSDTNYDFTNKRKKKRKHNDHQFPIEDD